MELLVGGVAVVVGEAETHQDARDAERTQEETDDGDGAAGTDIDGLAAEGFGERRGGLGDERVTGVDDGGRGGVVEAELGGDAGRGGGGDGGAELVDGFQGVLVGDEAGADFGVGVGGDDGLAAFADEAADDAVDFESGAGPGAREDVEAGFAGEDGGADLGYAVVLFVEGEAGPGGEFFGGGGADGVVEAGDEQVAVAGFEGREDLGDGHERVGSSAAVGAAVEVLRRAVDVDFSVDEAAEAGAEGGEAGSEHFGIADDSGVGGEFFDVGGDVGFDVLAAGFFFAFDEDLDVAGEAAVAFDQPTERGEEDEGLAFVVAGAAGVDVVVFDDGFEGRGVPEVEGVGGLDVVVAVEEEGGLAGGEEGFGVDEGVAAGGFDEFDVGKDREFGGDPFGGAADVGGVGGVGGDAGDAEEFD